MKRSASERTAEVTDALLREKVERLSRGYSCYLLGVAARDELRYLRPQLEEALGTLSERSHRRGVRPAPRAALNRDPAVIEVGSTGDEREIVFFVRVNSVGFDVQYLDKFFSVFQHLHNAEEFEGTGIELANVKLIVKRHAGLVRGMVVRGKGLPSSRSRSSRRQVIDDSSTILHVEDNQKKVGLFRGVVNQPPSTAEWES